MKRLSLLFFTVASSFSIRSFAFPEMATHGYPNCVACHVSPSGGGTLSDYGRSLSKDLLSTWSYENEEQFGEGLIGRPPEWLQLGGDFRYLQNYVNNDASTIASNFWMQNQLEAAIRVGGFYLDSSLGIQRGPSDTPHLYDAISARHYLGYYLTDEISVRFGKFLPTYGLNLPNHMAETRYSLGFDEGMERLNLEAAYLGEKFDFFLTALLGKADLEGAAIEGDPVLAEHGASLSTSAWLMERFKIGVSLLYGNTDAYHRFLSGVFGVLKISTKFYLLSEWDWQSKTSQMGGAEARGFADYNELGFEAYKGIKLYLLQEESYLDLNTISSREDSFGAGFKFYPRPHFEFQAEYRRQRNMRAFSDYGDTGFLMGHYYF